MKKGLSEYYQSYKPIVMRILLVLYSISALPDVTMMWIEKPEWMWRFNQLRSICVAGIAVCAVLTVIMDFIRTRDQEKSIFTEMLRYPLDHLMITLPVLSGFLIYKATGHTLHFKILLMLIAMSDTDYDTHLKDLFVVNVLFMFAVIMLFHFGVISEATATRPDGLIRHSLGYIYPLDFHAHLVSIVLMYLYFRKDKFGIIDLALINAANLVLYKVTDSRTDMLVIILGSVILFVMNKINTDKLINRFTEGLAVIYTVCIGIIPFILTKIYDPASSFMNRLNRILSDRLAVQQRVVSETGIPMFGRFMIWNGNGGEGVVHVEEYNWIDSSFLRDSIDYGWIFVVLMLVAFILLYHHLFEKKNKEGILVITLFLLNALLEHNTMLTYVFPVMLMLSEIIMKSSRPVIDRLIR